jgi:hypothetical protein
VFTGHYRGRGWVALERELVAVGIALNHSTPTTHRPAERSVKNVAGAALARSDSGQGVTVVSFVRCVDRRWRCAVVRAGRTGLT